MNACMTRGASPRAPGTYVLPDVLGPGLAVVFCGTAAGAESARRGAYYAGPGNAFWHTLYHVGLTPRQLQPEEYRLVGQFGLGLTDLAKHAAGADAVLSAVHFDRRGLHEKISRLQPAILAFTGKRAAAEFLGRSVPYGLLDQRVGDTLLFTLPSPSGAARRYWSVQPWQALARLRQDSDRQGRNRIP